jgi:hypothetical protein
MFNLFDRISEVMATIKKLLQSAPRMRNVTPVPNGPLVKKKGPTKGSTLKKGGKVTVEAGGEKHVVYKAAKKSSKAKPGDIIVNHPTKDKGQWDTINLTKKAKSKTVKEGVAATKKWHKDNPDYKYKKSK